MAWSRLLTAQCQNIVGCCDSLGRSEARGLKPTAKEILASYFSYWDKPPNHQTSLTLEGTHFGDMVDSWG